MNQQAKIILGLIFLAVIIALPVLSLWGRVRAATDVFASPIQAGCYIAAAGDCRIHVDPFTIVLNPGSKLVYFSLVAQRVGGGQTVLYNFKPDLSNPVPLSGSSYSPSLVTQDFGAVCGKSYQISLQGQDTLDSNGLVMGGTGVFACPSSLP